MDYLGYAALVILGIAALICFIRSYLPVNGKLSRRFVDIGLMLVLLFVAAILATMMSVTALALIAGSSAFVVFIGIIGASGVFMLVLAAFYESWARSLQAWRHRRDQRKMKRRDQQQAEADEGAEFFSNIPGQQE